MPLYDYKCTSCGNEEEIQKPMIAIFPVICSECGHEMIRQWKTAPAVSFKGGGFYRTDNRK